MEDDWLEALYENQFESEHWWQDYDGPDEEPVDEYEELAAADREAHWDQAYRDGAP